MFILEYRKRFFNICIVMVLLVMPACSIINPHITPSQENPYLTKPGGTAQVRWAGDMDDAISYANCWRKAYYDAVGDRSKLRNGTALALVPMAAVALYNGITGGSTNTIAALGVSGAGVYALGNYFDNRQIQEIYTLGSEAIGCALEKIRPFLITADSFTDFNTAQNEIQKRIGRVHNKIAAVRESLRGGNLPGKTLRNIAIEKINAAQALVARGGVALANSQKIVDVIAQASLALVNDVENIRDHVSREICKRESTLESLGPLLEGMGPLVASFTPTRETIKTLSERFVFQGKVIESREKKDLTSGSLEFALAELGQVSSKLRNSILIVEGMQEQIETAQVEFDAKGKCKPEGFTASLQTLPKGPILLNVPGESSFVIKGGKVPYQVRPVQNFSNLTVKHSPFFSPSNPNSPYSSFVEIVASEGPMPESLSLLVIDGTGNSISVDIVIGQAPERVAGGGSAEGKEGGTPKVSVPGKTAWGLPLSKDQKLNIQRTLCVKADADYGPLTRRAVLEYQRSIEVQPQDGKLTEKQAEDLLALPECPAEFKFATFYERQTFYIDPDKATINKIGNDAAIKNATEKATETIKKWQKKFNELDEKEVISLDAPLTVNGILGKKTREAIKNFQQKEGIEPADGIISLWVKLKMLEI